MRLRADSDTNCHNPRADRAKADSVGLRVKRMRLDDRQYRVEQEGPDSRNSRSIPDHARRVEYLATWSSRTIFNYGFYQIYHRLPINHRRGGVD